MVCTYSRIPYRYKRIKKFFYDPIYKDLKAILLNEKQNAAQDVECYHLSKKTKNQSFWKDIDETYIGCLQGKEVSQVKAGDGKVYFTEYILLHPLNFVSCECITYLNNKI